MKNNDLLDTDKVGSLLGRDAVRHLDPASETLLRELPELVLILFERDRSILKVSDAVVLEVDIVTSEKSLDTFV